jgi:hypothetical protein
MAPRRPCWAVGLAALLLGALALAPQTAAAQGTATTSVEAASVDFVDVSVTQSNNDQTTLDPRTLAQVLRQLTQALESSSQLQSPSQARRGAFAQGVQQPTGQPGASSGQHAGHRQGGNFVKGLQLGQSKRATASSQADGTSTTNDLLLVELTELQLVLQQLLQLLENQGQQSQQAQAKPGQGSLALGAQHAARQHAGALSKAAQTGSQHSGDPVAKLCANRGSSGAIAGQPTTTTASAKPANKGALIGDFSASHTSTTTTRTNTNAFMVVANNAIKHAASGSPTHVSHAAHQTNAANSQGATMNQPQSKGTPAHRSPNMTFRPMVAMNGLWTMPTPMAAHAAHHVAAHNHHLAQMAAQFGPSLHTLGGPLTHHVAHTARRR